MAIHFIIYTAGPKYKSCQGPCTDATEMDFSWQKSSPCLLLDSVSSVLQNKLSLENSTYIALYTVSKFLEVHEETIKTKFFFSISKLEKAT